MAQLVFIGGVGKENEYGGELSKNKLIIDRLRSLGIDMSIVDTYGSHKNPFKIMGLPFTIVKNLKSPLIFSTNYSNIRRLAPLVRMINKKRRIVFWAIGGRLGREVRDGKYSAEELKVFDRIIVEAKEIREQLQDKGVVNAEYLPNFKNGSLYCFDINKSEKLSSELKCVFFSRIQQEKGVDFILDAIERARETGRNISMDFYGEIKENYRHRFLNRIEHLPCVRYCGMLNFFDGSGQKILSGYHLSLLPTYWPGEGFPGVIVDALMSGVPVLASDWNFNNEYINPDVGFLCRPKDSESFCSTLFDVYDRRSELVAYFDRCRHEGAKYDVNRLLNEVYVRDLLSL